MFDKEKFSKIIDTIVSHHYNNNIAEFARAVPFDRTYASKYLHQRLNTAPPPRTLQKIADASKGVTTYTELLNICGYLPFELNDSVSTSSLDSRLSEAIFNNNINLLNKYDLSKNDILELKKILIERNNHESSIESQLDMFATSQELFATLININDEINNALVNLHKNGYLYPIPIYKNSKNIDLFLISNIVDYVNYNVPVDMSFNDFFALLIDTDKMFPLLDVNDVAIIQKSEELENGQIVAVYSTTKECCLIGKLFRYENIIELSYLNSKSEKFIVNDIKFLGKVIKSENKSAFK